jgi:hypothetical protein
MNHDTALTTINERLFQQYPRIPAIAARSSDDKIHFRDGS